VKIRFESSFEKYLGKIRAIILDFKQCSGRITRLFRLGDYRIGIEVVNDEIIFARVLHRNIFPNPKEVE